MAGVHLPSSGGYACVSGVLRAQHKTEAISAQLTWGQSCQSPPPQAPLGYLSGYTATWRRQEP